MERDSNPTMAENSFKLEHPLEMRQAEASRIREKYPDRIPVIVEKAERSDIADIDKKKEGHLRFCQERIVPPTAAALMSAISDSEEHKDDEDGFLYMSYGGENTFGSS
ncbi:hypothetical protein C4D60_Mb04t39920 [Musa balbisiana]|uniref:Autophagy-related protein n=1 Tax=Musa balbisiana TaxID=52838 RepID=A0A4S8KI82_MUSBA|nr:hypothetical protein C4D60_Mb04t39920 [Musa balbisiana]